jgi:hypothetical protein
LSSVCHRIVTGCHRGGGGQDQDGGPPEDHPEVIPRIRTAWRRSSRGGGGRQPALNAETATTPQNGPETPQDERLRWGVRSSQGGRCQTAAYRCLRGSSSFTDHLLHDRMHDRMHDRVLHDQVLRSGQCGGGEDQPEEEVEDQPSGNRPDRRSAARQASAPIWTPANSRSRGKPGPVTNRAASVRSTRCRQVRSWIACSTTAATRSRWGSVKGLRSGGSGV